MRSTGAACVVDPLRVEQELVAILDDTARCERQLGEQVPDAMEALARLRPQALARSASALRPYTGPTCSPAVQHRALEVWRARLGDLPAAVGLEQRLMLLADWFPTEGCSLVPEAAQLLETFKYQPEHQFLSPLFEMVRLYDRSCKHSSGGGGGSIQ
jgi:hypothetical protein